MSIALVNVYLDDDVPEWMDGIIRCGSVVSEDENGKEFDHQELIDNQEFHSIDELIASVASRLGVDESIVEIVQNEFSSD